jgi:hypothetical protein
MTFGDSLVQKGDRVMSDVYSYVSPDYNGDIVMLMTADARQNQIYNLSNKGKWQKLSLIIEGNNAKIPVYMYFAKYGVTNFESLQGHVIFAHPTYRILHLNKSDKVNLSSYGRASHRYFSAGIFEFNDFFIQTEKGKSSQATSKETSDSMNFHQIYVRDVFAGPRLDHWRFGWFKFKNQYTIGQKVFGDGFNYMSNYGEEFYGNSKRLDWPHNPFISILLYAGIVGLIAYLWLLLRTVQLYWLYHKKYWPLFICFIIAFFFSFFSGNNPFDPPIIGFFVILPFFIHAIYKKNKPEIK